MDQEKKFKPGDHVTWTSQAGGKSKTKQGIVLIVVLAGKNLRETITDEQWRNFTYPYSFASRRDHESYLIQVGKSKRLYWPLVKYLKPVEMEPQEDSRQGNLGWILENR